MGFHYMEYYIFTYAFNQYLASMGYAVLSVNYRDGIGYGKDFRRASRGPGAENEYKDVVAAAKFLQLIPEVDKTKIGLWGASYGGYLTAMGLTRNPELFKIGADLRCINDWTFDLQDAANGWSITKIGTSTTSDLSKWTAPVLFVYGNDSSSVEFQQTKELAQKLREKNKPVELLTLPNDIHFTMRYEDWSKAFYTVKEFFDKKLK